jgi:hypothetical protein
MKTMVFKLGSPCDTPEMTKPPEGGLSPQEHQAKPDGRGGSCIFMIGDCIPNHNTGTKNPPLWAGVLFNQPFSLAVYFRFFAK